MDKHTQNDHNNPINWKESEEDKEHAKNELMRNTLQALSIKYLGEDATDYLNCSDELGDYDSDQLWEELNDNGFFNVEIIYYSNAMDYLRHNDISLNESLELAEEMGFTLRYINSETLASLHASHQRENKFYEFVAPELDKLFNN